MTVVPYKKFYPLIDEIGNILVKVDEITETAEHNKWICEVLKRRVYAINLAVLDFKFYRNKRVIYNEKNFLCLQNLITVLTRIKKFISVISQMNTLLRSKYIRQKNMEKTFKDICKDFDICIDIPEFTVMIKSKIIPEEEIEALKTDQEEMNKVSFKYILHKI